MKFNSILIMFLLLIFSSKMIAQDASSDSSFYQKALLNSIAIYQQSFVNQSALYNGSRYGEYLFTYTEGQPYYNSAEPSIGSITYDGIRYDSVLMRYDEVADVLVIGLRGEWIKLLVERIEQFHLYQSDFIRLIKDSLNNNLLTTGFYNLLYKGSTSLLRKQVKTIREVISSNMELQHFTDTRDHYYLRKDGNMYSLKDKQDLLKILSDHKKEVQQFIKSNTLSFRNDRQNLLIKTVAYYDSLKN